ESIAELERLRLASKIAEQRTFADEIKPRRRPGGDDARRRVDQVRIPLRLVQPRDRADGKLSVPDAELAPGLGDFRRGPRPAEFFERHAKVHDLHLRGRDLPRVDDEIRRTSRYRDGDIGERFERTIR